MVTADRAGNLVDSTVVTARLAGPGSDGTIWTATSNPGGREVSFAHYAKAVEFGTIPGPISAVAGYGSEIISVAKGSVRMGHLENGAYKSDGEMTVSLAPWTIPVALGGRKVALIDQRSGEFTLADLGTGMRSAVQVSSPELTRGAEAAAPQKSRQTITSVVVGAAADRDGLLYLLLGQVFAGEGARLLKVDQTGAVAGSYMCRLPGFFPKYIGMAGKDLYLVDPSGKGARFSLD